MGRSRARKPVAAPAGRPSVSPTWLFWMSVALVALNLWIYAAVGRHPFIGFDDPQYVADNRHVATGLTVENVAWALRSGEQGNWHPLTWISHMLDVELFGLNAGAHHLTSVAVHIANSLLLLLLLVALTGARWPSALVAALFAAHPMHVESVAWIAERKDVLSAFFWTTTILAYTAYAGRPSRGTYLAVAALFGAGLMSKPMVVTLPCVLLLLDVWPLGRVAPTLRPAAWWPLVREKLPLFAMMAVASVVTFLVQQQSGAVRTIDALPLWRRVEGALAGYQTYISRLFWPRDMAILYPFPESIPFWQVASAAAGLMLVTWLAIRGAQARPWFLVGWFWFLGTLVPVSGLVQVGSQPFADRFTYIPYTGLFIVLAWGTAEIVARRRLGGVAAVAAVAIVGVLATTARAQVQHWRDGVTLWTHALAVTERNYRAHSALGFALSAEGRDAEAVVQYEKALAIQPNYAEALANLGGIRAEQGDLAAATAHLSAALAVDPDFVVALTNLGAVRARQGRFDEARALLGRAREIEPHSALVRNGLGDALALEGRLDEARTELQEAIRLQPGLAVAHRNLGMVQGDRGELDAAIEAFRRALALEPGHARSHYGLGSVLDDSGRSDEAVAELQTAVRQDPRLAEAHNRLGRVLVKLGRLNDAIPAFDAAVRARPTEPDFHYDLGVMLLKTNRPDEAVRHIEDALRLDPAHAGSLQVLRGLGRIR
jgi:tetratricopeptide (TPR) repeat protein